MVVSFSCQRDTPGIIREECLNERVPTLGGPVCLFVIVLVSWCGQTEPTVGSVIP